MKVIYTHEEWEEYLNQPENLVLKEFWDIISSESGGLPIPELGYLSHILEPYELTWLSQDNYLQIILYFDNTVFWFYNDKVMPMEDGVRVDGMGLEELTPFLKLISVYYMMDM